MYWQYVRLTDSYMMKRRDRMTKGIRWMLLFMVAAMVITSCAPAPTATPVPPTKAPATAVPPPKAPATAVPPTAAPAAFDWKQQSGKSLNVILNKHDFSESIIPQIPKFTEKTGIKVTYEVLSEVEYFNKLKLELGAGAGLYDVFMTGPQVEWQYYPGKWLEPLEPFLTNPKYTDIAWYKPDDLFASLMAATRRNGFIRG